jgi:TRAP-type mannitol/chloroaromatic compound transport system permease large subunit
MISKTERPICNKKARTLRQPFQNTNAFTPTEAAAMSAVYAFVIAVWVYRDMKLKDVPRVLLSSANMSAMILYIITNAVLFSFSASRPAGDDSLDQG